MNRSKASRYFLNAEDGSPARNAPVSDAETPPPNTSGPDYIGLTQGSVESAARVGDGIVTLRSLYVDFDSYFASVEQQVDPALRGRPIGVAPVDAESTCCIAASYEAKRFGVRTGTIVREARQLCPDIAIVIAQPRLYVQYHLRLIDAIKTSIPVSKIGSIDEMACTLIGRERQRENAVAIAKDIKAAVAGVAEAIHCSIGIAPNEFLAKTATDMQKPDGLVVLEQDDLPQALYRLDLRDLCGIGASMERRLAAHGIHTVEQLCTASAADLRAAWGSIEGERFHDKLRGRVWEEAPTQRRSIGHSHVLAPEYRNRAAADAVLKKLLQKAAMRLRDAGMVAGLLQVKVKYLGADSWEASCRLDNTDDSRALLRALMSLLAERHDRKPPLAVGVTLTQLLERAGSSGSLFPDVNENPALTRLIDRINGRYGNNKIFFGGSHEAMASAPMRIAFNRIPDAAHEDEDENNEHWLKRLRQAKVLAQAEHRKAESKRSRS